MVVGVTPSSSNAQAEEGVDERALARVELAHHHEEEQLVELAQRALEGVLVLRLHVQTGQHRARSVRRRAARRPAGACWRSVRMRSFIALYSVGERAV